MAIRNLFNNKTEEIGKTEKMICPVCKKETALSLFSNYDSNVVIGKLLGKDDELNFAVCPLCTSVFKVNMSAYGIKNSPVKDYHLILIDNSKK